MTRRKLDVVGRAVTKKARKRGVKVYEDDSFQVGENLVFDGDTGTIRKVQGRRARRRR